MSPIPIHLVVEDSLSEDVLRKIIGQSHGQFAIGKCYSRGGFGYIKDKICGFNNAARGTPFLVLADLEAECPPAQIKAWLPVPKHPNLLFRIAVREVESWLMADGKGFASFLGIRRSLIPSNVDEIHDPKQCLIALAKESRKRELCQAIVPPPNSTAKVGPDYNGRLSSFVFNIWNIVEARKNSVSLRRTLDAINSFQPTWRDS